MTIWVGHFFYLDHVLCTSVIRSVPQLQQEYITVLYLNICVSLHLRTIGAHSPPQCCIAEDSPGMPLLCTKHRGIQDVLCSASSVSHGIRSFARHPWAQTHEHPGWEEKVLFESFYQPVWPSFPENVFLNEDFEFRNITNLAKQNKKN